MNTLEIVYSFFLSETKRRCYSTLLRRFGAMTPGPRRLMLASCLLLSAFAAAQSSVSSVRGMVVDPSGAVIPGAQVLLENREIGFSHLRAADSNGQFQFQQIPSGSYTITVNGAGFSRQSKTIVLMINQPSTVNFVLAVESKSTAINVIADTGALNSTDATMGNAVSHGSIESLPMEGRNVPDLLSLQPGVLYLGLQNDQSHDSRSGASAGARSDQGNVTLDGVDNNEVRGHAFTGALRSTLDSVEEFRVVTAGFNAETGRSSGAQVNLQTRSGTNDVHGSLYEYNRNTLTAANDWFNKQAELLQGLPNVPGKLIRNTYGASLGGPIKKNKLFFFANYEGQQTSENKQQTMIVPTASLRAGTMKYPSTQEGIQTLTPAQIASMDPNCGSNGTCPWGPGVDPYSLAVFNQYPLPNGVVAGDGLNTASYTWSAPDPASLDTYIAKLDYVLSNRNWLFVRGTLQNDKSFGAPQFPGQPASSTNTDNSKGFAAGYTSAITSNLTNSLRYGLTRQGYASRGIGQGSYANFYGMSPIEAETRTSISDVPVQNVVNDLTWIHRRHTLQFGANYRLVHNHRQSDALSYDSAVTNSYALAQAGIVGTGQSFDPASFGFPAVDNSFANSYNFSMANLAGLLDYVTSQYNYQISPGGKTANLLPPGAMINREFKNNEFEYYLQDSWRALPNLTINFGLRHTLLQTPYEIHGQQVQPTTDLYQWFETRGAQAALGNSVQPYISFAPSGQAPGLAPYWPMQKNNIAPRLSFAYSPNIEGGLLRKLFGGTGKSAIRAGYGIYYDHFGESVVDLFDQYGSFGLTDSITNPTNVLTSDNSPRFTGLHGIPQLTGSPDTTIGYPALSPTDPLSTGFAITHGLSSQMRTPYSHVLNVSWQRELLGGFTLETAYLGRFGRHLLQQIDLAQPLDLVDRKSGQDYFTAATQLSKLGYAQATNVPVIPFFEDMFPDAAAGGLSATQNIYNTIWRYNLGNETASLYDLDILCYPGCGGKTGRFWPTQFASLYSWASIGTSNYNGGQVSLRHPMSHGVQLEISYTFSKSMDMGSDAERTIFSSSTGSNLGSSFSAILNAWNPKQNYAPSDFDVRHLVTANWGAQLPFGKGKAIAGNANRWLNGIVGDWQLSGLARWTSGLPFSVISGSGWGTNWAEKSGMVQTGPIQTGTHIDSNGAAQAFADPAQALSALRNPYPGEAGQRNNFRGDGYFGIDARLSKTWKVGERNNLRLAWDVFNVTNSVRFDVNALNSLQNVTTSGSFGVYSATLTTPRVQQFSLAYSF